MSLDDGIKNTCEHEKVYHDCSHRVFFIHMSEIHDAQKEKKSRCYYGKEIQKVSLSVHGFGTSSPVHLT